MAIASTFSIPFVNTPAYYTGTAQTDVVPSVYPVAINGRPYLIDMKSGRYVRSHEQRVRDSQDTSTAPGEAAINPGGLWRRGQDSWHLGAGQQYADTAEAKDYMFYKSKGINPWVKGQVSLLNTTALNVGSGAPTTATKQLMCVAGGYIYVADGQSLKRTTTVTGNWTTISTGAQAKDITALVSDGTRVFIGYTTDSVHVHDSAGTSISSHTTGSHTFTSLGYANGRIIGTHTNIIMDVSTSGGGNTIHTNRNAAMRFVGSAGGNSFIYIAGFAGDVSLIYKTTLKADGTALDDCSVAGQLPYGEIVSSIDSYLGFIFIGTKRRISKSARVPLVAVVKKVGGHPSMLLTGTPSIVPNSPFFATISFKSGASEIAAFESILLILARVRRSELWLVMSQRRPTYFSSGIADLPLNLTRKTVSCESIS